MIPRQEADSRLLVRETLALADGVLLEDLHVFRAELPGLRAVDTKALERHASRQESHTCSLLVDGR